MSNAQIFCVDKLLLYPCEKRAGYDNWCPRDWPEEITRRMTRNKGIIDAWVRVHRLSEVYIGEADWQYLTEVYTGEADWQYFDRKPKPSLLHLPVNVWILKFDNECWTYNEYMNSDDKIDFVHFARFTRKQFDSLFPEEDSIKLYGKHYATYVYQQARNKNLDDGNQARKYLTQHAKEWKTLDPKSGQIQGLQTLIKKRPEGWSKIDGMANDILAAIKVALLTTDDDNKGHFKSMESTHFEYVDWYRPITSKTVFLYFENETWTCTFYVFGKRLFFDGQPKALCAEIESAQGTLKQIHFAKFRKETFDQLFAEANDFSANKVNFMKMYIRPRFFEPNYLKPFELQYCAYRQKTLCLNIGWGTFDQVDKLTWQEFEELWSKQMPDTPYTRQEFEKMMSDMPDTS